MSTFIRSLGLEISIQLGTVEMLNASEDVVDLALFAVLANKFYCRRSHCDCHFCAYPLRNALRYSEINGETKINKRRM